MTALLLSLVLAITPKQCDARPEWCTCRQFVEAEANQCEVDADRLKKRERAAAMGACKKRLDAGRRACDADDGDIYLPLDLNVGSDE